MLETISNGQSMPSENSTVDRFTLFGVNVHIEHENGCVSDFTHLLLSRWNAPEFSADGKPIYIVLRPYIVKNDIPKDTFMADGSSLAACSNGIRIFGDGATGHGICSYPAGSEAGREFSELIETLTLYLVAQSGRIPLHASAAIHDNIAVVFAGRSGAGKSSMAFAAGQAGMAVLSDDTVYVQCAPRLCVWGMPTTIHLLPSPERDYGNCKLRYRGGRWKRALPVGRGVHLAGRAILCVLTRGEEVGLDPMDVDEAIDTLTSRPEPGYGFYGCRSADAIRAIAAEGCFRLTLARDPSIAITTLLSAWPLIVRNRLS